MFEQKMIPNSYPLIIDGGLSKLLEEYGCDLNHDLWSAIHLKNNPEKIIQAHFDYIIAGARVITSASYQASVEGFQKLGMNENEAEQLILQSIKLCELAIQQADVDDIIYIAASMGPYGAYLADGSEYTGYKVIEKSTLLNFHKKRMKLLGGSSADILAFETIPDIREVEVICDLIKEAITPAWLSLVCKDRKHLSDGSLVSKAASMINETNGIFAIGINCTAPEYVSDLIKILKEKCPHKKVLVYPNSGESFNTGDKTWSGRNEVKSFAEMAEAWLAQGVDMIGGCCRVGRREIGEVSKLLSDKR